MNVAMTILSATGAHHPVFNIFKLGVLQTVGHITHMHQRWCNKAPYHGKIRSIWMCNFFLFVCFCSCGHKWNVISTIQLRAQSLFFATLAVLYQLCVHDLKMIADAAEIEMLRLNWYLQEALWLSCEVWKQHIGGW